MTANPPPNLWHALLMRQCAQLRGKVHPHAVSGHKVAVLVEPRRHPLMEAVVRNVMHYLGDDWNLRIYSYEGNEAWLRDLLPEIPFRFHGLPFENMNQILYNHLLMDPWFWHRLPEEHVLIFQTDCMLFRSGMEAFLDFDYVGGNFYRAQHLAPQLGGVQGGLSLRRRSAMLDCLAKVSWGDIQAYRHRHQRDPLTCFHEDIFFTHACEILGKRTLPIEARKLFAIEAEYYDRPLGHHGTQHPYFTSEQVLGIISQCEDRAMWSCGTWPSDRSPPHTA